MSNQAKRIPIIGVMGSHTQPWAEFGEPLGCMIAELGFHLLTGAGAGVMSCVCQAFIQVPSRKGLCVGIVPCATNGNENFASMEGYPNAWTELPIITPLPVITPADDPQGLNRNYINILTSAVIVALPGNIGTINEVELSLRFSKPVILFGPATAFTNFPTSVKQTTSLEIVRAFILKHYHLLSSQDVESAADTRNAAVK